jgi:CheY-like chemotaxis protein
MHREPLDVLLVEDNAGEARLVAEAFKEMQSPHRLIHVSDGEAGLNYLSKSKSPAIILLDLNLPGVKGHEILAQIKTNPQLRCIPIVIFSNSQTEEDIRKSYDLAANCYVSKPRDLEDYLNAVKTIEEYWLSISKLPMTC